MSDLLAFGMSPRSFPSRPRRRRLQITGLLAVLILAGCGGSGSSKSQTVKGDGFSFEAPAGWTVLSKSGSTAASSGALDRLQVSTFRLEKDYHPALFVAASKELDRAADGLATQLDGKVTSRSTVDVAGRKARSYTIEFDGKTEEIVFVLDGKTEYELLCRRATSGSTATCEQLFSSFAIG
jgi:hypothetical protein